VSRHLYNAFFSKVIWFVRRFGWSEVMLKPVRVAFSPWVIPRLTRRPFEFDGRQYECFFHRYNMTWAGERMVEIPVALEFLKRHAGGRVLEVGNVLGHYISTTRDHVVVDKYERGPGVINEDILSYRPEERFDAIVSISTFEHIGFDDDGSGGSGEKILAAVRACRALLKPGGRMLLTVPLGYNPEMDALIREGRLGVEREGYLRRVRRREWEECDRVKAMEHRFGDPYPYANAVLLAEFGAESM
jgi:SAM-dependent methyltransferase